MLIGRRRAIDSRDLLDALASGRKPRRIASDIGCQYASLRKRLSRHVRETGFLSVEQAVAHHVAAKIKAILPLALKAIVDQVMQPRGR